MIYGYSKAQVNDHGLLEMKEITFAVDVETLEEMAKFLQEAATQIRTGKLRPGGHRHVEEFIRGWRKKHAVDVIVVYAPPAPQSPEAVKRG